MPDYKLWLGVLRTRPAARPPGLNYHVSVCPDELKRQYLWLMARYDEGPEVEGLLNLFSELLQEAGDDWLPPESAVGGVPARHGRSIDL